MRLFAALSAIGLCASVANTQSGTVEQYISSEGPAAKAGLLANIGPDGAKSSGAFVGHSLLRRSHCVQLTCSFNQPGVVIASPSTENPNYLYTWIRDSSLVFKVIIDQYTTGQDASTGTLVNDFIIAYSNIQQVNNPSGKDPLFQP